MKKIFAVLGLFFSLQSQAAVISVELDNTSYQKGDVISASIWMNNLGTELADFNLDLWFTSAVLSFDSITFGKHLSIIADDSIQFASANADTLNISETSFIEYLELLALQSTPDQRFQLATMTFIAKKAGAFALTFDSVAFTDGWGFEIPAGDIEISNARGSIIGVEQVPAPATLLLLAPALLWLARRR